MTATKQKNKTAAVIKTVRKRVVVTPSGMTLTIAPSTANPVSADEMDRQLAEWYARNKHLLEGYSSDQFVAEKRRDVKAGLL